MTRRPPRSRAPGPQPPPPWRPAPPVVRSKCKSKATDNATTTNNNPESYINPAAAKDCTPEINTSEMSVCFFVLFSRGKHKQTTREDQ